PDQRAAARHAAPPIGQPRPLRAGRSAAGAGGVLAEPTDAPRGNEERSTMTAVDLLLVATLLAALAGACALLFQLAEGLPLFIALSVLYGAFWTSVLPLTESYLLKRDKAALQNYGRVRAVGSLAFILTATLGGLLLGRFGQQLVPALVGLTMLLTALACLFLRR
ncbi:hypothetical protein HKT27_38915, partial [Pseudomonas aeruginosa]|nr:hypothetical protein [Pseudomonas aeruginosa]